MTIISIKGKNSIDNSHNYDYNRAMINVRKTDVLFSVLGAFSLFLGLFLYLMFRENSHITIAISNVIDLRVIQERLRFAKWDFLRFYFPDYLWAFSLSCCMHVILRIERHRSLYCTFIVFVFGTFYELMQCVDLISGTGDLVDVSLYLLAGLTVNIIFYKGEEK